MTDQPTISTDPTNPDQVLIHFPEFGLLDTQAWSVDVGIPADSLPPLRDAITTRLAEHPPTDTRLASEPGYHAGVPHGLYPPGFHDGPPDDCDDTACHGQAPRTDPAADLEAMLFTIAAGGGVVMPGAAKAAIRALARRQQTEGTAPVAGDEGREPSP